MCVRFLTAVFLIQVHSYITKQHFANGVAFPATNHALCHRVLSVAMCLKIQNREEYIYFTS